MPTTWTKRLHFWSAIRTATRPRCLRPVARPLAASATKRPQGNIGINIGVAAPMAYFPFSGWKDSFFGIMHGQGRDAIEFYTDKKIVVERWAKEHSRKF